MAELIVVAGILLWYAFAAWAVKHEEELRDNYRLAKEMVDRWFPKKDEDKKDKEEMAQKMEDGGKVRKIRLAYLMGMMCEMYDSEKDPRPEAVGLGHYLMFLLTPEEHAGPLSLPEKDVYKLGKVTAADVTSVLKTIYGEDYEEMAAMGVKDRKEYEQEKLDTLSH